MEITKEILLNEINKVMHPEINHSLVELGIINNVDINKDKAKMIFAFPFPDIPIANVLINSVEKTINNLGLQLSYNVRLMTEDEKNKYMIIESNFWEKGV